MFSLGITCIGEGIIYLRDGVGSSSIYNLNTAVEIDAISVCYLCLLKCGACLEGWVKDDHRGSYD